MIQWDVTAIARHMERHGLKNANDLHKFAGLTQPTAYNVVKAARLARIECETLERLAKAFACSPWDLLDYTPD